MAIIQQKERELRYAKQGNLQQEAAVSANYMRDMIRAYGLDLRYYKLKCPYPEIFKPILDMNKLTMHAYGYDPTPEYEVETPIIAYWQFSDDTLVLNQYGVQPNRVAKCWIDATDFAIAFAKTLSEYKEYKVDSDTKIEVEFDDLEDFTNSINKLQLKFSSKIFNGECNPIFTEEQIKYLVTCITQHIPVDSGSSSAIDSHNLDDTGDISISTADSCDSTEGSSSDEQSSQLSSIDAACRILTRGNLLIETPHVVPDFWKGKQYEDFIDDTYDSYIRLKIDSLEEGQKDGSVKMACHLTGAIIYYDLHVVSKYHQFIKPDVGDVLSIPVYNHGDTVSRFEIVHIQGTKYNETYENPFLRNYIYECDLRVYVSSGEKVPEERDSENQYRRLNELINFANSEAGRKMSLYKDHEEDIYGGYDKVSGLDGAILAQTEKQGKTINAFDKREDKGIPPYSISDESIVSGEVTYIRLADLVFPTKLSVVIAKEMSGGWCKLLLMPTESCDAELITEPWQHYLRASDDSLILREGNCIYRLASMIDKCELYDEQPQVIIPRRLKRNVYAQHGGYNDQPFDFVDTGEDEIDLGQFAETLTGPTAGEEYKGKQIKNSELSRMTWRNTRTYMDVTLMADEEGNQYYQLAVKFKGDKRNRRFPLAICRC